MEHTTDKAIAREIAMDHIYEDPNYYSKLKQIETEGTCGYTMDAGTGEELETPGGLEEGDKRGLDMYALELQKGLEEAILNHLLNENENITTSTYPFEVTDRTYDDEDDSLISVSYELTTPYNSYKVEFYSGEYSPESKKFDLSFGVNIGYLNKIDTFQMTDEGNAKKIFNTILNIVEDFINKEDVKKIVVDGTDEKRKRIYKAIFSSTPPNISDKIELKEANLKGTMTFRNWTDSIEEDGQKTSDKNMDDYKKQNNPSGKVKDPFGLNQFARELVMGLEEADPKTGTGKKPKGSSRRLYTDEDPSDTVKVKFSTKQDIIDTLSKASFKSKSHARQSQIINLIHQRVRAAYERAKDPEVKKRLKTALDYAEQRKEASKEKTQRLKKIKEASNPQAGTAIPYGSGYKELIPEITKFMLDKGMNLRPLPKVKFIEDDKENAEDVLGRTAFYNPEEKSVTLYTLGRHPKDILRSFCHEMIHHLQNVEDRLPKFYTTNTQEDSALNDIEEEAHRLGSMTMREFEDTIKK
jgi:hypothetical protein